MKQKEILEKVIEITIDKIGLDDEDINKDSNFAYDLGCDSLDGVELIMAFEMAFDISIHDKDAEDVKTVSEAVDLIGKLMN